MWGADRLAAAYFGLAAADLDDDEAARLAAALPSPTTWHPASTSAAARRHADTVRRRMDKARFPQEADLMTTPIFRSYDRKALDAEYNNRLKVKDALEWMARDGAESARARAELPLRFDVPYGAHTANGSTSSRPPRLGPGADSVFIHGGYWHRIDKTDFSFVVRGFRPAGAPPS